MRTLLISVCVGVMPAIAAEPSDKLTPRLNEGWIRLFDGETTFGWKAEGEAKVSEGVLVLGGSKPSSLRRPLPLRYGHVMVEFEVGERTDRIGYAWESRGDKIAEPVGGTAPFGLARSDGELAVSVPAGKTARIRSIDCLPGEGKSVFNGKDLTGWKLYDPAKAKAANPMAKEVKVASAFTVTPEGGLNVKNGPGDLQTDGQWADFVLQFECISNGKHLNSGLFFRCIPDLYQQGYEAQIRNEWTGDDRTKPVDFGTGAIYRRQAARKVVSSDGEWFTMTVAARGRHIATWVNGYQTADWTDDRKEADNGRNGFKASKGAFSLQGHDPTTNLSFRNLRVFSLDK